MTGRRRADHARPVECPCETCRREPGLAVLIIAGALAVAGIWIVIVVALAVLA